MPKIRNVVIGGRRTSMRLEPEIWAAIEDIAAIEGLPVGRICALIKERGRSPNLSSSVRVFTLLYGRLHRLSSALDGLGPAANPKTELVPPALAHAVPLVTRQLGTGSSREEGLSYAPEGLTAFPHPVFLDALSCWHRLRPGKAPRVPAYDSIRDRLDHLGASVPPPDPLHQALTVNVIDVRAENPQGFLLGPTRPVNRIFAGMDISHMPVAEHPFALHARSMQSDFNLVKSEASPTFQVLRHTFGEMRRHYARLALPLTRGGRTVDVVMTICARLSRPSFCEPGGS